MKYSSKEMSKKAIETVACLMVAAAETAPKGKGVSSLECLVIDGEDITALTDTMRELGKETGLPLYDRDSANIDTCEAVVLFGAKEEYRGIPCCGFCGAVDCGDAKTRGMHCAFSIGDLGIALGSASALASHHHIDNRIMFSAGKASLKMDFFSDSVTVAYAIPLSVTEKSPFFDR